jgi:hypothetical protein
MPPAVFELATPATKRPQTYALDCAVTEIGFLYIHIYNLYINIYAYTERG